MKEQAGLAFMELLCVISLTDWCMRLHQWEAVFICVLRRRVADMCIQKQKLIDKRQDCATGKNRLAFISITLVVLPRKFSNRE